jgi:hypothetical protein
MKYPLPPATYTFSASAKTITFSGAVPAHISNIMHVTNMTRGVLYFQPQAGASFTGTYSSPVLTLAASTTGHADTDQLLIVYDDGTATLPAGAATAANQATGNSSLSSIDGKLPALSSGAVPVAPSVQQGSGVITATTQRVTLATDGPTVSSLSSIDTKTPALVGGAVPVVGTVAARTPTTTSVASSASSVTILASNANRRGVSIANVSTAILYLSFSGTATTANSFIAMPAGSFLLLDQQLMVTNAITGIWSAVNGTAQVTEFV